MDNVFQALSHADRRQILRLIKANGELNAGELAEHFDFSKPTLSHHLKVLAEAGLIERERRRQYIYYQLNQSVFEEIVEVVFELFAAPGEEVVVQEESS